MGGMVSEGGGCWGKTKHMFTLCSTVYSLVLPSYVSDKYTPVYIYVIHRQIYFIFYTYLVVPPYHFFSD